MLSDYTYELVSKAVKALIATEKFVPTIADVIEKIQLITTAPALSEVEAWGIVKQAIRNGWYHSKDEFDQLPEAIQAAIGRHEALREWSQVKNDSIETVVGSNFMRSYRSKQAQTKALQALPADVKEFMAVTSGEFVLDRALESKNKTERVLPEHE